VAMQDKSAGHHPAVEQYLETILELEESGITPMRARLVERLGVSAPAVSETVKRLEREGYVTLGEDRVLHLTDSGREYGSTILRRHRLAEALLVEVLKVPWAEVHDEACRLEHAISANLEKYLVALLGDPGVSPYGNAIPGSANAVEVVPVRPLSSVAAGSNVVVARIDEHLQTNLDRMRVLDGGHLRPGTRLTVSETEKGRLSLRIDGSDEDLVVDGLVAEGVYVSA
jgi:DtxR family Mn-dependent transcriptional regulator